jgi:hypothetical protein
MPPLMRFWFNLHRHNTRPLKDRQIHRIERALIIWPLHAYMWVKRRRQPQPTITAPKGAFFMGENNQED